MKKNNYQTKGKYELPQLANNVVVNHMLTVWKIDKEYFKLLAKQKRGRHLTDKQKDFILNVRLRYIENSTTNGEEL